VGSVPPSKGGVTTQNNIQSFETIFRTNVAYAGLGGLRGGSGSGTITLSGVSGPVTHAFLFWHGPTNSSDPLVNANVTFAGNAIVGTNIGISAANCWPFTNSQAYRADVTSFVSGNGTYSVANLIKTDAQINGVELIVFYDSGNPATYQDVVLFDGNDSNVPNTFDADGWNVSLPGINYTSGPASLEMIVSDGQSFPDDALVLNGKTLVPTGSIFEGDTVPDAGTAGTTHGGLWDQKNFDITSFLSPGPNTLTLTSGVNEDCLSLIVAAVMLPPGAAPNQPALITVTKQIAGTPPPAGTTFVVDVTCTPVTGGQPQTTTVRFDQTGTPIGNNVVQASQGSSCQVAEEALTGAAAPAQVSYTCTPAASQPATVCADASGTVVTVGANTSGPLATVAVTNSYVVLLLPKFTG
jgi:hypothetical protein